MAVQEMQKKIQKSRKNLLQRRKMTRKQSKIWKKVAKKKKVREFGTIGGGGLQDWSQVQLPPTTKFH